MSVVLALHLIAPYLMRNRTRTDVSPVAPNLRNLKRWDHHHDPQGPSDPRTAGPLVI